MMGMDLSHLSPMVIGHSPKLEDREKNRFPHTQGTNFATLAFLVFSKVREKSIMCHPVSAALEMTPHHS